MPTLPITLLPSYNDTPVASSNWRTIFRDIYENLNAILAAIPTGGTTGQVALKQSTTDYTYRWATPVLTNELVRLNSLSAPAYITDLIDNNTLTVNTSNKLTISKNYSTFVALSDVTNYSAASYANKFIKVNSTETGLTTEPYTDVPSGIIVFWYGTAVELAAVKALGWKECGVDSGAPAITDGFIRAGAAVNLTKAGATTVTLSTSTIPSHTHTTSGVTQMGKSFVVKGGSTTPFVSHFDIQPATGDVDALSTGVAINIVPPYRTLYLLYKA